MPELLPPTSSDYDYVNYVPNTQSNKYRSTTLIWGLQEMPGGLWLQILIGDLIQTRLLEEWVFLPKFGRLCAGFLAGAFFFQK